MSTILHIDQDESTQSFIQSALGKQYNVITAADGPTAIQYCAMIQPDLILMNLVLPGIDGCELASRLKMFMPQTPILIVADNQLDQSEAQALLAAANGILTKPFDAEELRQWMHELLPSLAEPVEFVSSLPDDQAVRKFEAQIAALNQANKRLASLNAISALIGTSLDLEHLADEMLTQIYKTVTFDSATLFLLKGNLLEAAASRGFSKYGRGMNNYSRNEHNSAWRVVDNKLPLIINDVTKSEYWESRPELDEIRSWLGVPLVYNDRVVGVLTLDNNQPNAFTDADARYVFTLAYQIASAVENTQLFAEWEKQSTHLKLINEVSQEITTILNTDDLFEALARTIFERLHYDHVAVLEVDETRSFLRLKAIFSKDPLQLEVDNYRHDINEGLIGRAIRVGLSVLVNDTSQDDDFLSIRGLNARSELVVPIFVGTQVEAVINVGRNYPDGFGDEDLWTLSSLASQAATVIENAQLYRQVHAYSDRLERIIVARTRRLQAIKKISQAVSQGLALDELLTVVGRDISQIFSAQAPENVQVAIGLVEGDRIVLKVIYEGLDNDDQQPGESTREGGVAGRARQPQRFKIDPGDPMGQVIRWARSAILNNFGSQTADAVSQDMARPVPGQEAENASSLMMAPLITGGKTIGLIRVKSKGADAFDESDLETLETLAFQVASAVEHARLLQKTREIAIVEERNRLARDMHDGVAQNLAYLLIQVDRCLNMVDEDGKLETQLEQISSLLRQNIGELRRNIFDLRPIELGGKSLFAVLENFVTEFGRRWDLNTTCHLDGEPEAVSLEVESSLYRILQEALSNAQQHAQCTRLSVSLAVEDNQWVTLEVKDDGQGYDANRLDHNHHKNLGRGLGLVSMRERANSVGGQLTIESAPGQGTRIFAKLPLGANATNNQ